MSRPRTASQKLEAKGSFARNPARARVDPVIESSFPTVAPSHLNPLEVRFWHEIRRAADKLLTGADVFSVELAARLWAEFHVDSNSMQTSRISLLGVCLGRLGLSPTDRTKLAVAPEKKAGDFDEF